MADSNTSGSKGLGPTADAATGRPIPPTIGGRVTFPGISRRAWEHPADKAAMSALRKVPGFDMIIRKFGGFVSERILRYLYLANAVRVSDKQFSRIHAIYQECLTILDVERRPDLFVAQTPIVNAGAIGLDRPFIVLNSGTLTLLGDDELRAVLGHELGHVLSDHALYKTMLAVLLRVSIGRFGIPLAPLAVLGVVAALREWSRKAELSADRCGLLCVQDSRVAYTVHMKMAGGSQTDQMDVDEFVAQAEAYERDGNVMDSAARFVNLLWRTHPFPVLRLAELKRWVDAGGMQTILNGDYPRRQDDAAASVAEEVKQGAESYRQGFANAKDPVMRVAKDLSDLGERAWGKAWGLFGGKPRPGNSDGPPDADGPKAEE